MLDIFDGTRECVIRRTKETLGSHLVPEPLVERRVWFFVPEQRRGEEAPLETCSVGRFG